jgi:hypothetical protein
MTNFPITSYSSPISFPKSESPETAIARRNPLLASQTSLNLARDKTYLDASRLGMALAIPYLSRLPKERKNSLSGVSVSVKRNLREKGLFSQIFGRSESELLTVDIDLE